jgi:hypothetical protein
MKTVKKYIRQFYGAYPATMEKYTQFYGVYKQVSCNLKRNNVPKLAESNVKKDTDYDRKI